MKRVEEVYRELLYQSMEKQNRQLTQLQLSRTLSMSLSMVHFALEPLRRMNAIEVAQRKLSIIDQKKILYYWASIRSLYKDVIYRTRVDKPVKEFETEMPPDVLYAAFSAFRLKYSDVPADYSEVYIYASDVGEIQKRFPPSPRTSNLFCLKQDSNLKEMTLGQLYVDLWNLQEWYAKEYLQSLQKKVRHDGFLE